MARHPWGRAGGHLPAGPRAWPNRIVGLHRHGRITVARAPFDHHSYHLPAHSASSTPMSCLAARASSPWRGDAERLVVARAGTSNRQPLGQPSAISTWRLQKDLTARYEDLRGHYRMTPTRNNGGSPMRTAPSKDLHGHSQRAIEDALLMGRSDFDDLAAYRRFIDEIVGAGMRARPSASISSAPNPGASGSADLRLRPPSRLSLPPHPDCRVISGCKTNRELFAQTAPIPEKVLDRVRLSLPSFRDAS